MNLFGFQRRLKSERSDFGRLLYIHMNLYSFYSLNSQHFKVSNSQQVLKAFLFYFLLFSTRKQLMYYLHSLLVFFEAVQFSEVDK